MAGAHLRRSVSRAGGARRYVVQGAIFVVALACFAWRIGQPSEWRDEAATMVVSRRSLGQIVELVHSIDLVHLVYYLLAHLVVRLDASTAAVRLLSAVAMALAAAVLLGVGRRLGSATIGVVSASVLVVVPLASRYAQEARSPALVTLVAVVSTYLLLGFGGDSDRPLGRVGFVGYLVSVVFLALFNVLALMLLAVHGGYLLINGTPAIRRRWAVASAAGLLVASPFVVLTFTQRSQVAWIERPKLYDLRTAFTVQFGSAWLPLAIGGSLVLLVVAARLGRVHLDPAHRAALLLGALWAYLPAAVLWLISQVLPLWDYRYLAFTLPGTALLVAAIGSAAIQQWVMPAGRPAAVLLAVGVLTLGGIGLPAQAQLRDARTGHAENLRGTADYLGEHHRPGDGVLYFPSHLRPIADLFPQRFAGVDDVALDQTPLASGTIFGVEKSEPALTAAMAGRRRVWLISQPTASSRRRDPIDLLKLELLKRDFRLVEQHDLAGMTLRLYSRA